MIQHPGLIHLLKYFLLDDDLDVRIHLFKNDYTPTTATVVGDLTEADFAGYAHKANVAFPDPTINGSNEAESNGPELTWTRTSTGSAQTIYGLYITFLDTGGTRRCLYAERFASPVTVTAVDDEVVRTIDAFLEEGS